MKINKILPIAVGLIISLSVQAQRAPVHPNQQNPPQQQHHVVEEKTTTVRFYYLPEFNAYYDQQRNIYFYKKGNKWKRTSKPTIIGKNIAQAKREPLKNFKGSKPYSKNDEHQKEFNGHRS